MVREALQLALEHAEGEADWELHGAAGTALAAVDEAERSNDQLRELSRNWQRRYLDNRKEVEAAEARAATASANSRDWRRKEYQERSLRKEAAARVEQLLGELEHVRNGREYLREQAAKAEARAAAAEELAEQRAMFAHEQAARMGEVEKRAAAAEQALREIAEKAGYASGGSYQPDIARMAREALGEAQQQEGDADE
jgi:general stress protein YciG